MECDKALILRFFAEPSRLCLQRHNEHEYNLYKTYVKTFVNLVEAVSAAVSWAFGPKLASEWR